MLKYSFMIEFPKQHSISKSASHDLRMRFKHDFTSDIHNREDFLREEKYILLSISKMLISFEKSDDLFFG